MKEKPSNISYFISFCIEQYKNAKQISGAEAMQHLDKLSKNSIFQKPTAS